MEPQQDESVQAQRAGEWDTARAKLADLIDNPEKTLPVAEYRAHLRAAQKAVARAYKAMLAARSMTITEFLEARIAEDETLARQEDEDYADTTLLPTYDSDHQANWNTTRTLAECAAKRAILELHQTYTKDATDLVGIAFVGARGGQEVLGGVLKFLAAVYADHPDYLPEWSL